jgi:hypothetical protein
VPSALLSLTYAGVGGVSPGQALTEAQVGPTPTLTVTPANSSVSTGGSYTIAMVDAGPVGTNEAPGQTRHWLVNGATITGSTVSNASSTAITRYAGPAPPAGSGPHRYVVLLYSQPSTFSPPAAYSQPNIGVSVFSLADYVTNSGLGPLLAATYFTVQEGTATVSLSPTTAVVTSTLVVPTAKVTGTSTPPSSTNSGVVSAQATFGLFTALTAVFGLAML